MFLFLLLLSNNKAIFKAVFGTAEGVWSMLIYAVIVTLIAVLVTIQVGKAAEKAK